MPRIESDIEHEMTGSFQTAEMVVQVAAGDQQGAGVLHWADLNSVASFSTASEYAAMPQRSPNVW